MSNPLPLSKDSLVQNQDVLVQIFSFFIPAHPSSTSQKWRRQLLDLALICKAFLGPALDCLWSHIESLEPLFKLHPAIYKVVESYVSDTVSLSIRQVQNHGIYSVFASKCTVQIPQGIISKPKGYGLFVSKTTPTAPLIASEALATLG